MQIKIISSHCSKLDSYAKLVHLVLDDLDISATVETSSDDEDLKRYEISDGCGYHYCGGCNRPDRNRERISTPALVINDKVVIHSCFPKKSDVRYNILYCQKYG